LMLGGLASEALIRVEIGETSAREIERWNMGRRIRDLATDAQGQIYVLEDGDEARLLHLSRGQ
ncbi:MAG: PQQ-dependent sugar dehydrogenase, partial [Pacificibacter sp.]